MPVSKSPRVSPAQVTEWTENPVTLALKGLVSAELRRIMDTPVGDCLVHGEPNQSHENLVDLESRAWAWSKLWLSLEGDWDYLAELDDEE